MRLYSFVIKNVKSIVDSDVCYVSDKDGITILAGQNEVGKSAALEGLDFFRNGPSDRFTKLSKRYDSNPYVLCTFTLEELDKTSEDEDIKKVLKDISRVSFTRGNEKDGSSMDVISFNEETQQALNTFIGKKFNDGETPEQIEANRVAVFEKVRQHLLNRIPGFILFDTFSDLLPGEILIREIPSNNAVQDFQKVFGVDFADIANKSSQERNALIDAAEKKATTDLNTYWSQVLTTKEDDKYNFKITLIPSTNPDEARIEFMVHRNDSRPLFLEQKSKGFQWFNAFNLRLKALGVKKSELENYVVLIDEPGQGLHETAQKDVKKVLEELASKGMQIIYSTHHANLIGVGDDEILRIRLVSQDKNKETLIQNIAQFSTTKNNLDALSPVITAMGISHIGGLIDKEKASVVLEGITDHYYLSAFQKILEIKEEYSFIPACGVQNVRPLVSIVIGWGGNFRAVFDDGAEGKSAFASLKKHLYAHNEELLGKQILKLDGFEGIEDLFSKSDFDKYVTKEKRGSKDKDTLNSILAKSKKKELLARMFLLSVNTETITLSKETLDNFSKIFDFLKKK